MGTGSVRVKRLIPASIWSFGIILLPPFSHHALGKRGYDSPRNHLPALRRSDLFPTTNCLVPELMAPWQTSSLRWRAADWWTMSRAFQLFPGQCNTAHATVVLCCYCVFELLKLTGRSRLSKTRKKGQAISEILDHPFSLDLRRTTAISHLEQAH